MAGKRAAAYPCARMKRLVEIRSYRLQPGAGARLHELFVTRALPMLRAARMDVVAHGASLHDADAYFLVRAFDDLAHRQASQNAFYGSDAWRQGPREEILALIAVYTDTVLWLPAEAVEAMRRSADFAA